MYLFECLRRQIDGAEEEYYLRKVSVGYFDPLSLYRLRLTIMGFTHLIIAPYHIDHIVSKYRGLFMSYFGESTLEHKVLKYMEGIKNSNELKDFEVIRIMNKVVEYYRDSLVYEFNEDETNTILQEASDTSIREQQKLNSNS